jgi:3-hydroxy-9,10-secoandrosta-1,3,5(10)-triene-9,17-dione monooxygenase reductase component
MQMTAAMAAPETGTAAAFDGRALRNALGNFATGVTVITARTPAGETVGVTANSFNSVSLDPPLVLWSLARKSRSLPAYLAADHFAVHVLAADQVPLSQRFATPMENRYAGIEFRTGAGGAPLLEGCAARFQCKAVHRYEGGDHLIIVGEVVAFDASGRAALLYYKGGYAVSATHPLTRPTDPDIVPGGFVDDYVNYLLRRCSQRFQRHFEPVLNRYDVNHYEWRVLALLSDRDGRSLEELAAPAMVPVQRMIGVLDGLQAKDRVRAAGLAAVRYRLTPAGAELAMRLRAEAKAHEADVLSVGSADEGRALKDAVRRLSSWLSDARAPGADHRQEQLP